MIYVANLSADASTQTHFWSGQVWTHILDQHASLHVQLRAFNWKKKI